MKMKKGIVVIVVILCMMTSVIAEDDGFGDVPLPPSVGAPGSVVGSPPEVQITSPTGGTVSGVVPVTVSATDDGTVTKVELFVDNVKHSEDLTVPYSFSVDMTTLSGDHTLKAVATDNEEQITESVLITVTVGGGGGGGTDTMLPTVSITSPVNGATVSCVINVNVDATDNVGVDRVELYVGLVKKGTDTSVPYSFQLDTTAMSGSRTLKAKALDAAGNSKEHSVTVTIATCGVCNPDENFCDIPAPGGGTPPVDTTSPTVTVTSPIENTAVMGIVPVIATVMDNIGVAKVEFFLGTELKNTDTTAPYGFDLDTAGLSGTQVIKAKAFDAAGNSAQHEITVTISAVVQQDTTIPIVTIVTPLDQATVTGSVVVSATATDNVGVTKVEFFIDNVLKETDTTELYGFTLNTAGVAAGPHIVKAVAQDAAGNNGEKQITVLVEAPPAPPPTSSGGGGSTSSGGGGSSTRTFKNYQQTRGIERDTNIVPQKTQPVFNSPIANPVVPAPRIEPMQPEQPIYQPPVDLAVEEEPIQLWVIIVTSVGALLLLAGVVVLLLKRRVPQEVVSYIKSSIEQGYSPDVLEQSLIEQGWSQKVVQRALRSVQNI